MIQFPVILWDVRGPCSLGLEVPGIWVCILVFFILHSSSYVFFYCITCSQIHCIALCVCKFGMGFSVLSIIWVGVELIQITMQHNSPSLARKNKIENDPKLLKKSEGNRDDEWNFCWGQEADIALFLQETRIRKIIKSLEENFSIIAWNSVRQGDQKQRTLKHRNKPSGSKCTNHK